MDEQRLSELVQEADDLRADNPDHFEPPGYNQPDDMDIKHAQDLLGDDAPWHRVAHVAHALGETEEHATP
jgi:hypothetical protein